MDLWDWSNFEEKFSSLFSKLGHSDLLPENIHDFRIERNSSHRLLLTVHSQSEHKGIQQRVLGEVYKNDSYISIDSPVGEGGFSGVAQVHSTSNLLSSAQGATKTVYEVNSFSFKYHTQRLVEHTIDYIANVPGNYIWPSAFTDESVSVRKRIFSDGTPITFQVRSSAENMSRSCLRLKIDGYDIIIGKVDRGDHSAERPGYILYVGSPSEASRRIIRDCLSFAFGLPLIYFGHACYCAEGKLTEFTTVSPHTFGSQAWGIVSTPPAPITTLGGGSNMLSREHVERVAQKFFDFAHKYNFEKLPWRLWYAEAAPYFMRPAYYGALIESTQKAYIEDEGNGINHTVVDRATYKKMRKLMDKLLQRSELSPEAKELFGKKINDGNKLPQKDAAHRFYSKLNLSLGEVELSAWNKRNDAAHGNEIPEDEVISFIRATKILRVMLNRVILSITDGSDSYVDYFTYGHPVRLLRDEIPGI